MGLEQGDTGPILDLLTRNLRGEEPETLYVEQAVPCRTTRFGKRWPKGEGNTWPQAGLNPLPNPPSREAQKRRLRSQKSAGGCQARARYTAVPSRHRESGRERSAGRPAARRPQRRPRAPGTAPGDISRGPIPPTSLLRGGAPSAGHAASAGLSFPVGDRAASPPRIWDHRSRCFPGGGPRLRALRRDPGQRRPGLSFPGGASSLQAKGERAPARRPGPRLTGRRGTISTEQQWQKYRPGCGDASAMATAASSAPPAPRAAPAARRRPFAAPLPADAPAHAHARHARHARRGVEERAGARRAARAAGACPGDGGRGGTNSVRAPLSQGFE